RVQTEAESIQHYVSVPTVLGHCQDEDGRTSLTKDLKGQWRKVEYANKSGYVFSAYLMRYQPPSAPIRTPQDLAAYWKHVQPDDMRPNSLSLLFKTAHASLMRHKNSYQTEGLYTSIQLPEFSEAQSLVWLDGLFRIEQHSRTGEGTMCEDKKNEFTFTAPGMEDGQLILNSKRHYVILNWQTNP
ncbi:MAG: hypothetical protein AAF206_20675, partial [Bacteroidota bacterium]